jgi:cobalt-zinc-cadmium efflux system protein
VTSAVNSVEGVIDVHDLHIWSLGSNSHALSCHVLIEDMPPSRSDAILRRVNAILGERFRIHHTTVQFEHASCEISDHGCSIPVAAGHHHHHGHAH